MRSEIYQQNNLTQHGARTLSWTFPLPI